MKTLAPEPIARYVAEHTPEVPLLRRLREETGRLPNGGMQIAQDQGALLAVLVRAIGARRALEIGVFTGYSSLCIAGALPADGRLVACDVSEEWTRVARRYWAEAGLAGKIDLRLGPAADVLADLVREGRAGTFDLAFIDADKENGDLYYERCLELVRPGGLVAVDNALWDGAVADPSVQDEATKAIRALNTKVCSDPRVEACLATIGDGMLLAWKRQA